MKIAAPKELDHGENRVAVSPQSAKFLINLGHEVIVQSGAGQGSRFADSDYKMSGCRLMKSSVSLWKEADVIVKVNPPTDAEQKKLRKGQILIGFIWPVQNKELLANLQKKESQPLLWTWFQG